MLSIRLRRLKKLLLRFVSVHITLSVLFSNFVHISIFILYVQIIAAARDVQEKTEIYTPYNILPLDAAGASVPIMQFEEVFVLWSLCGVFLFYLALL